MGQSDLSSGQWDGQAAVVLDLGASQTLRSATDLHAALSEAVGRGLPLVVDASSIAHLTSAAAQLLLAAQRDLAANGTGMTIRNPSGEFLDALQDLGIDPADHRLGGQGAGDG